jgi:hypothetical protein
MKPWVRAVVASVATLVAVEAALRVTGRGPWEPFDDLMRLPRLSEPDPTLGWVNRLGVFEWDGNTVSIGPMGRAHLDAPTATRSVGVFGCSYVYGFGVDDAEVLSHLLAEARPTSTSATTACPATARSRRWAPAVPTRATSWCTGWWSCTTAGTWRRGPGCTPSSALRAVRAGTRPPAPCGTAPPCTTRRRAGISTGRGASGWRWWTSPSTPGLGLNDSDSCVRSPRPRCSWCSAGATRSWHAEVGSWSRCSRRPPDTPTTSAA